MEPVVVVAREAHVGGVVHVQRRRDVDHAQPAHRLRVVDREAVRDAPAAVMADQPEALVAQRAHQRDHVGRHRALAVVGVVGEPGRFRRIAVAAQVGHHEEETVGQPPRDAVPQHVRLRKAVQQQQRRAVPVATGAGEDARLAGVVGQRVEAFEELGHGSLHECMVR